MATPLADPEKRTVPSIAAYEPKVKLPIPISRTAPLTKDKLLVLPSKLKPAILKMVLLGISKEGKPAILPPAVWVPDVLVKFRPPGYDPPEIVCPPEGLLKTTAQFHELLIGIGVTETFDVLNSPAPAPVLNAPVNLKEDMLNTLLIFMVSLMAISISLPAFTTPDIINVPIEVPVPKFNTPAPCLVKVPAMFKLPSKFISAFNALIEVEPADDTLPL